MSKYRKKLTELCTIQYGYAFDSDKFTEDKQYIPLVRIRDVKRGYSETFYRGEYPDEYVLHSGDLLIGMDGEFNIARWRSCNALLNQRVCKIVANDNADEEYLRFYMMRALKEIEDRTSYATVKHLSAKELNKLELDVPEYFEQRKIAKILAIVEMEIELREKELEEFDNLIKSRFVEMFGDVTSNPNGYLIKDFDEVSILITDGEHATPRRTEAGIYLLSARNVLNHALQLDDVDYIDEEEYNRIACRVTPQEGDVLISCSGSIGRCCVVPSGLKFQMVRSVALIRFDDTINPVFAEWLITSDDLQRQIAQSATQSSQANLFQGKIRKLNGYVPPLELQDEFEQFVIRIDKLKVVNVYLTQTPNNSLLKINNN